MDQHGDNVGSTPVSSQDVTDTDIFRVVGDPPSCPTITREPGNNTISNWE